MPGQDMNLYASPGRSIGNVMPQLDGAGPQTTRRGGRWGELYVLSPVPSKQLLADEGSYFVATNPTPGTAITLAANITAFTDTNGMFVIANTDSSAVTKRIYLDYLRLILTGTAPTATQSMEFAIKRSIGLNREPTAAANRTLLTPVNVAGGAARGSVARVLSYANAGAMTIPASNQNDVFVCRAHIPTGLGITGDEYIMKFGGDDTSAVGGMTAVRASSPARIATSAPPIIIEPGEWHVLHMWWLTAATTAASFEFELGWWER